MLAAWSIRGAPGAGRRINVNLLRKWMREFAEPAPSNPLREERPRSAVTLLPVAVGSEPKASIGFPEPCI